MMKRKTLLSIIVITFALVPCLSWAQSGWTGTDVPWMPYRDTNHIHIIRTYNIDTATLERKLVSTIEYDRHGYQVSPSILLKYNEKEQLVKYVLAGEKQHGKYTDPTIIYQIQYNSEGVVCRVKYSEYYNGDSSVNTYELVTYRTHPTYGVLDCSYLVTHKEAFHYPDGPSVNQDTAYYHQQFDKDGHLLHRTISDNLTMEYTILNYHYDATGLLTYRTGEYFEFADSLVYQYGVDGKLTGMTGTYYDLGEEGNVVIRCRPDGKPIEAMIHWHSYADNPYPYQQTQDILYDSHGLMVSSRLVGPDAHYIVSEIEYWE